MNDQATLFQPEVEISEPIYTPKEAAAKLDCSERTIWNRIKRGELLSHLVNGLRVIPQTSLDLYLEFKSLKIRKTEYVPDGCSVVPTVDLTALVQQSQRLAVLNQRLIEYQEQEEETRFRVLEAEQRAQDAEVKAREAERERIRLEAERATREKELEELRADRERLQEQNETLKGRGFFARIFRRGEGSTPA